MRSQKMNAQLVHFQERENLRWKCVVRIAGRELLQDLRLNAITPPTVHLTMHPWRVNRCHLP